MGRVERFENSKKQCCRRELEGYPVVVTVKQKVTRYRNKDIPTILTRWTGRHLLELGSEVIEVDGSLLADAGPTLGVSLTFERHREVPPTEAEIKANRENINRVLRSICGCEVIDWGTKGA